MEVKAEEEKRIFEIHNDDCFNIFPTIEKLSIDLVLVDLPYAQTACVWDCMIDLTKMWIELKKICKRDCVYVFFCTTKFGYKLIQSNEKWFRYDLVWEKSRKVGFLSANKMPLRKHEMVYVFKEQQGTYNPQKTEGKPYKRNRKTETNVYGTVKLINDENKGDRHPTSILHIPEAPEGQEQRQHEMVYVFKQEQGTYNPQKTEGKRYVDKRDYSDKAGYYRKDGKLYTHKPQDNKGLNHPTTIVKFNNPSKSVHRTQKPVELCEWLIKSYSNEGDTILDFTMGSGTTGVACKNTKRGFIGIEMDKDIFEIAKGRM